MAAGDIVYALRTMRKNPGFTATAVAALAIGIGANSAIFSVVNAVLLRPLSYPDAGRIVLFYLTSPGGTVYGGSAAKFNVLRQQMQAFQDVSAYEYGGTQLNLTGGPRPEQVHGIRVSEGYFRLFGAPLVAGRSFTPEEDRPGGGHVAILSYGLWQRRFGGDAGITGKTISLSGVPYTVVGIAGPSFRTELDLPPDVWLPFQIDPASADHAQYFNVVARLRAGIAPAAANAPLELASAEFRRQFPHIMGPRDRFAVQPFQDALVSEVRPSLLLLAGAVGLVLLMACANVANLLLVRATGRKREFAIRAAIGAARGRIVRQLLIESAALSMAGGALGLMLGLAGVRALLALNPGDIPRLGIHGSAVALNWQLVLYTLAISMLAAILFGLAPAWDISRIDLGTALKSGGGRSGAAPGQNRARTLLVIGEVAVAVVLLAGAALLIRSYVALRSVDPGFDPHHVLTMRMALAGSRFQTSAAVDELARDAARRLEGLPEVTRAAASYTLPLEGAFGIPFNIVGRPPAGGRYDGRGWVAVSPGYFEIFRIPILRGRGLDERDGGGSSRVALINDAMARQFWPHGDPLGARVILGQGYGPEFEEPARQIVGVVGDVHDSGLNHRPAPLVYVPLSQVTDGITSLAGRVASLAWVVRGRAPSSPAIENVLEQASGGLPVAEVRSMDQVVNRSTARADFDMSLLTIFGGAALLLATIGIYGLMAYSVRQRTAELGIRVALGADTAQVRNMILLQGMRLASIGIVSGLVAAWGLTRLLAGLLFGVAARDPLVFTAVPLVLGAVALLAVWIPALRAAGIEPIEALRAE